jgi:hypothetical protein
MISLDTSAFRSVSPLPPKLRAGEVHLWMAELGDVPERLRETLSPDEWVRSSRFHFSSTATAMWLREHWCERFLRHTLGKSGRIAFRKRIPRKAGAE